MTAVTPRSAAIFVAGMFAVTACPPVRAIFSELRVVRAAIATGHGLPAGMFLAGLLFAFFGLTRLVFAIVDGRPRVLAAQARDQRVRETASVIVPPLLLLGLSLWLGLATPAVLREAWTAAVAQLFPSP